MVSGAFNDRRRARIPNAETLARDAAEISFPSDRSIHYGVPDNDILFGFRRADRIRIDDDASTRESFTDVIIGRALQFEGDAVREECTKALPRDAVESDMNRVRWEPRVAVAPRDVPRQHRPDRTVRV